MVMVDLGSGSFGEIFLGTHVTNGAEVAIKLEPVRTMHPQLLYEAKVSKIQSQGSVK